MKRLVLLSIVGLALLVTACPQQQNGQIPEHEHPEPMVAAATVVVLPGSEDPGKLVVFTVPQQLMVRHGWEIVWDLVDPYGVADELELEVNFEVVGIVDPVSPTGQHEKHRKKAKVRKDAAMNTPHEYTVQVGKQAVEDPRIVIW